LEVAFPLFAIFYCWQQQLSTLRAISKDFKITLFDMSFFIGIFVGQ